MRSGDRSWGRRIEEAGEEWVTTLEKESRVSECKKIAEGKGIEVNDWDIVWIIK